MDLVLWKIPALLPCLSLTILSTWHRIASLQLLQLEMACWPKIVSYPGLVHSSFLKDFCLLPDCPLYINSVQSLSHVHSLLYHGVQHARLPCPLQTPRACSNSYPSCQWCYPTISSSVVPFSSRLRSFPASGSFKMSQFFTSGSQSIGVSASASVLPMNIQD